MKLHDLLEQRAAAVAEMRALVDKAETEKRDLNQDEDTKFGELKTKLADLDKKIERARTLQEAERSAPAVIVSGRLGDGQYETRARQFSLVKAINAAMGDPIDVGFEREISQEVVRRSQRKFQGIPVPDEYFHVEKRTQLVGSSAADLYQTQHRPDLFIDALRDRIVVGQLGATVLSGLVGDQDIPRQTGSSTAQWVGEDGALSETDASFDDVTLSPKTVGAVTSYSRRTLINATPGIEGIVRNDLASVIANAIDLKALTGDGTGNTPTGILHASGVHVLSLATPSWAEVLEFPARIQSSNADIGSLAWVLTAAGVKLLRSTPKVSSTDSVMIMESTNNLVGYPAAVTQSLTTEGSPETSLAVFGAFSQLLVGYWSGVDILANPFDSTAYLRGRVLLRAMRDLDVGVRHGQSFAVSTDLLV